MSGCPTEDQLAGYALGDESTGDSAEVRAHVAACADCRAWLDEARAGDDLLQDMRNIVVDHPADPDSSSSALGVGGPMPELGLPGPPQIEGYEIKAELGRGGMGVVYEALQKSTKRTVALKVLLDGALASAAARRRFEREVELAAQLHHPNIATILESGIASGRYYFAMQFVDGRRLDQYVTHHGLSLRERLSLLADVCSAVNYAHQRGIIHRDLKPSNILTDPRGQPHVLDFGLAKMTSADDSDDDVTMLSMTGQVMGTLPYLSPEQTSGNHRDTDIRADVYSLGVILYHMLTGQFPYPVTGPAAMVLRNIVEAEPRRPSSLQQHIDDEVETIVLKSLAKQRDRRYQTAGALADDIRRYLAGQPIEAKRDSGWYVTRKLLNRYRRPVGAAAVSLVLAVITLVALAAQRVRIQDAQAANILAASVDDADSARELYQQASAGVQRRVRTVASQHVESAARTARLDGVRSAYWYSPEAFWHSVDDGPLWEHGEWLELLLDTGPADDGAARLAADRFTEASDRPRYVALCLAGHWAAEWPPGQGEALLQSWRDTLEADTAPGVVMAAVWATRRVGLDLAWDGFDNVLADEISLLEYVRLPGVDSFQRGSDEDEPDRLSDEDRPAPGVRIQPFWMATTEVTWTAFRPFLQHAAESQMVNQEHAGWIERLPRQVPPEKRGRVGVGFISLNLARAYCDWLNERAAAAGASNRYRLPTEDEWEYACRGGGTGRFCYGDEARYASFFANCDGNAVGAHVTGERLPNWFGMFDMHGGLWERCDTPYETVAIPGPDSSDNEFWVYRGGAYYSPAVRCRSAQRNYGDARTSSDYHGCRIVMELDG